jgi:hypothetical protein
MPLIPAMWGSTNRKHGGMAQVIECLPSKHLSSNPSTAKKKKGQINWLKTKQKKTPNRTCRSKNMEKTNPQRMIKQTTSSAEGRGRVRYLERESFLCCVLSRETRV